MEAGSKSKLFNNRPSGIKKINKAIIKIKVQTFTPKFFFLKKLKSFTPKNDHNRIELH